MPQQGPRAAGQMPLAARCCLQRPLYRGVTWSQVAGGTRVLRPTLAGDHRGTPPSPRQHRVRPALAWATANGACARRHHRRPAGISGGLPSRSPRWCRGRWFGCAIAGPIRGRPGGRRPQALLTRHALRTSLVARERGPESAYPDRLPARRMKRSLVNVAQGPRAACRRPRFHASRVV